MILMSCHHTVKIYPARREAPAVNRWFRIFPTRGAFLSNLNLYVVGSWVIDSVVESVLFWDNYCLLKDIFQERWALTVNQYVVI